MHTSQKLRQRMFERVQRGLPSARVPIGYRLLDGPYGEQRLVPDPRTAPLVRKAIWMHRSGKYSLRHIHKTVSRDGLLRPDGMPMSFSGFRAMLMNPFYEGRIKFEGKLYQADFRPLVPAQSSKLSVKDERNEIWGK